MAEHLGKIDAPVMIGVGAAFDFHAGGKRQAPRVIQRSGLEWAFRLASEPRRLGRRYAVTIPSFLLLGACQALGLKNFSMAPDTVPFASGAYAGTARSDGQDE
jgi:N-acetylglucosaminyldiphosphoundecaprenol N-acetyl-beta-D-mannosaminyltransferase